MIFFKKNTELENIMQKYSKICVYDNINLILDELSAVRSLKAHAEKLSSENALLKQNLLQIQSNLETNILELRNKTQENDVICQQISSFQVAYDQLNTRASTLEKMLQEKDRLHQDLLGKYKLLQDELNQIMKPAKKTAQPYKYEINNLKQALANKLQKDLNSKP